MVCPQCGAHVDDNSPRCPHCMTSLTTGGTGSKTWVKGVFACSCGCLLFVLLIAGGLGYGVYRGWQTLQKQIENEPLVIESSVLSQSRIDELQQRFQDLQQSVETETGKGVTLQLDRDELNYMVKLAVNNDETLSESLVVEADIIDDAISAAYSYKVDETHYFNGKIAFTLSIDGPDVRYDIRKLRIGSFDISPSWLKDIHSFFSNEEMGKIILDLNGKPREEFPVIIDSLSIKDGVATAIVTGKSQ